MPEMKIGSPVWSGRPVSPLVVGQSRPGVNGSEDPSSQRRLLSIDVGGSVVSTLTCLSAVQVRQLAKAFYLGLGGSILLASRPIHYLHRLHAHPAHPTQQVDDPLLVVGEAVGVELLPDGRVPRLPLLVLVQHPLQGGAAAQPVLPRLGRNARQRGAFVQGYRPLGLVGPQDGPLGVNFLSVVALQRVRLGGLEPDV